MPHSVPIAFFMPHFEGADQRTGMTLAYCSDDLRSAATESGGCVRLLMGTWPARGLSGVALVNSDAHSGLVEEAIGATLPGASWRRCRTH